MKVLYDLPLRIKFAIVLIPLIAVIMCFDYLQIKHNHLDYLDSKRLNKTLILGVEINHVVHELQKERSISVGFLSNQGFEFSKALSDQRHFTDSTLGKFYEELQDADLQGVFAVHKKDIDLLKSSFASITELRKAGE